MPSVKPFPVVLDDGSIYGSLCCFSFSPNGNLTGRDLQRLDMSGKLIARRIDEFRKQQTNLAIQDWSLEPIDAWNR